VKAGDEAVWADTEVARAAAEVVEAMDSDQIDDGAEVEP